MGNYIIFWTHDGMRGKKGRDKQSSTHLEEYENFFYFNKFY